MNVPRVSLVFSANASFVETDRKLLGGLFPLRIVHWKGKRSIVPLAAAIARSDVVFAWFAADHAYVACRLARLLGRKSIVFVGGADAAKREDLGYGIYLDPGRASRSRYAVLHADGVLVVDDSLKEELHRNGGISRTDLVTVPLGFDTDWFSPDGGPKTEVLTVGIVNEVNVLRKGLDVFLEAARLVPDLAFVLVGCRPGPATDRLVSRCPPNLRLLGPVSDQELRERFRRARVYAQLSRYEAFGSALGEAMACACVPVGTSVGGIPSLIGDTGACVPVGDAAAAAVAIREAYEGGDGRRARNRIVDQFSLERRRGALARTIAELTGSAR